MRLSIQALPGKQRILWTFTKWGCFDLDIECKQWSLVSKRLVNRGFRFVRVFEIHPGGHGLHVHCVAHEFIDIRDVYECCIDTIFGHIDVEQIEPPEKAARYVSKYLSKQCRIPALKSRRLWASCGHDGGEKVLTSEIEVDSIYSRFYREALAEGAPNHHAASLNAAYNLCNPDPWEK